MPAGVNECIPFYEPGQRITGKCSVAVTGKRFVRITANRTSGPGLSATAEGGVYQVGPPAAGGAVFGVAAYDGALNEIIPIYQGPGFVVPVRCSAAVAAGDEVQVDATGQVLPFAAGVKVGYCVNGAAINTDAEIQLY
jgi:Uncharacterized conserved protein (DUF2190)